MSCVRQPQSSTANSNFPTYLIKGLESGLTRQSKTLDLALCWLVHPPSLIVTRFNIYVVSSTVMSISVVALCVGPSTEPNFSKNLNKPHKNDTFQ